LVSNVAFKWVNLYRYDAATLKLCDDADAGNTNAVTPSFPEDALRAFNSFCVSYRYAIPAELQEALAHTILCVAPAMTTDELSRTVTTYSRLRKVSPALDRQVRAALREQVLKRANTMNAQQVAYALVGQVRLSQTSRTASHIQSHDEEESEEEEEGEEDGYGQTVRSGGGGGKVSGSNPGGGVPDDLRDALLAAAARKGPYMKANDLNKVISAVMHFYDNDASSSFAPSPEFCTAVELTASRLARQPEALFPGERIHLLKALCELRGAADAGTVAAFTVPDAALNSLAMATMRDVSTLKLPLLHTFLGAVAQLSGFNGRVGHFSRYFAYMCVWCVWCE
jgi:hypothetical protein